MNKDTLFFRKEKQSGSGTEREPEIGTAGTVFPKPKAEPEPFFPVKLYWNTEKPFLQRNRQNRKPEPLEPVPSQP